MFIFVIVGFFALIGMLVQGKLRGKFQPWIKQMQTIMIIDRAVYVIFDMMVKSMFPSLGLVQIYPPHIL